VEWLVGSCRQNDWTCMIRLDKRAMKREALAHFDVVKGPPKWGGVGCVGVRKVVVRMASGLGHHSKVLNGSCGVVSTCNRVQKKKRNGLLKKQ